MRRACDHRAGMALWTELEYRQRLPAVQSSIFDGEDPTMLALFWEAMHSVSTMTARRLGEAVDFSHFRRLLDIGGGSGAYDIELCKQYGELRATAFDLPHVAAIAAGKIS